MANAPESPTIKTWPSGGTAATILAATTPPAPGMFSTTKGLLKTLPSLCASRRARMSGLPPGAAAATSRTGRDGYSPSCPDAPVMRTSANTPTNANTCRILVSCFSVAALSGALSPAPYVLRQFDYQAKLFLLEFRRYRISGVDAGKAALGADGKAIDFDKTRRLLDAALDRVDILKRGCLGRYQTQHHGFVLRNQPKRGEGSGTR